MCPLYVVSHVRTYTHGYFVLLCFIRHQRSWGRIQHLVRSSQITMLDQIYLPMIHLCTAKQTYPWLQLFQLTLNFRLVWTRLPLAYGYDVYNVALTALCEYMQIIMCIYVHTYVHSWKMWRLYSDHRHGHLFSNTHTYTSTVWSPNLFISHFWRSHMGVLVPRISCVEY